MRDADHYPDGEIMVSCDENGKFQFQGCINRQCSIPAGYVITKDEQEYASGEGEDINYNTFADFNTDDGDSVLVTQIIYRILIIILSLLDGCTDGKFNLGGCEQIITCTLPEGVVSEGYLLDNRSIDPGGEFEFSPFSPNDSLNSISCSPLYEQRYPDILPTMRCTGSDIELNGCSKRKCMIPIEGIPGGYRIRMRTEDYRGGQILFNDHFNDKRRSYARRGVFSARGEALLVVLTISLPLEVKHRILYLKGVSKS